MQLDAPGVPFSSVTKERLKSTSLTPTIFLLVYTQADLQLQEHRGWTHRCSSLMYRELPLPLTLSLSIYTKIYCHIYRNWPNSNFCAKLSKTSVKNTVRKSGKSILKSGKRSKNSWKCPSSAHPIFLLLWLYFVSLFISWAVAKLLEKERWTVILSRSRFHARWYVQVDPLCSSSICRELSLENSGRQIFWKLALLNYLRRRWGWNWF